MIIGITGPKQSGKSTLTKLLVDKYGFTRTAFADPIKIALMEAFGLTWEQVYGSEKEIPTDKLCGQTPRHAMKTLGTEWGREMIHPDIWLTAWRNTLPKGDLVIEDVRFPNEHAAIKQDLFSYIIAVRRPGHDFDLSHESEAHGELAFDWKLDNDSTVEAFREKADAMLDLPPMRMLPRLMRWLRTKNN